MYKTFVDETDQRHHNDRTSEALLNHEKSFKSKRKEVSRKITLMVIWTSALFILGTGPITLIFIFMLHMPSTDSMILFYRISNIGQLLTYSLNIFIYFS
jgi:hypothetical protein